jgi:branched-chain amino acid transport system substrate-binding protein
MPMRLPGRRAALVGVLAAALTTMGVSKCGGSGGGTTVTVSGQTLTIYASAPRSATGPASTDVLDAERLALSQMGSKVSGFTINFKVLTAKPSANARTTIQDTSAIAYLGELEPGISAGTIGITNAQDLLQVSPTDTALELTRSTPAVPGAPDDYLEAKSTYGRTFARVAPSSSAEAKAQVALMRSLSVKKLYVTNDRSPYGKAIAYAVRNDASGAGISVAQGPPSAGGFSSSGADALFFGASREGAGTAARLFGSVAQGAAHPVRLFAPSALTTPQFASSLGAAKLNLYVSQPGFMPNGYSSLAKTQFVKPFQARYGHAPSTEAIFGYEAMAAVLSVLHKAGGDANNRTTVVHDFFAIRNRGSVVGTYSIDSEGDPSIAPFVFSRFEGGTLVPWRAAP